MLNVLEICYAEFYVLSTLWMASKEQVRCNSLMIRVPVSNSERHESHLIDFCCRALIPSFVKIRATIFELFRVGWMSIKLCRFYLWTSLTISMLRTWFLAQEYSQFFHVAVLRVVTLYSDESQPTTPGLQTSHLAQFTSTLNNVDIHQYHWITLLPDISLLV